MASSAFASEIAFFDVETSTSDGRALLEFGAILVCPSTLVEVTTYATFVRPADLDTAFPTTASRWNGITYEAIAGAPPFRDVADLVYDILHGRVWAGHNITEFDARIIRKAFADIDRPPPKPKGVIDTLHLLSRFGRKAGNMKMESLAKYFGLGRQSHRSLDDVRMNLQILKCCSTVIFLEANPPEVFPVTEVPNFEVNNPSHDSPKRQRTACLADNAIPGCSIQGTTGEPDNVQMDSSSDYSRFLEPDNISTECIKIIVPLLHRFGRRTIIQHKGAELQLHCTDLRVHPVDSGKFLSNAGRPKLSIVVDIPDNLSSILEFCDDLAKSSSPEAVSDTSEWKPLVKYGHMNRPMVRLHIPTVDAATYSTDICKKERNGTTQKLDFRKVDAAELDSLLGWSKVEAFLSLEVYEYQQNAGIRLVAKRLVVHST